MGVIDYNNRLDYGQQLMPEDGWATSWAIGTTYSLDLEVLMTVPLALFHRKYLSEQTDLSNLRTDMLDALDKVNGRLFIFVHENNITSKCGYSMLMGFLDQSIWNIPLDSPFKSFHPKVWLIRYEKDREKTVEYKYRLIVMSRNLTSATDFDAAVTMDSIYTEKEHHENESLSRMMTWLMQRTDRKGIISQIQKELRHITFIPPYSFGRKGKTALFLPRGLDSLSSPLLDDNEYEKLLVISPFVDNDSLSMLSKRCQETKPILVSSSFEMDKCDPEILKQWDCYAWNSMLEEASCYEEYETSTMNSINNSIRLHAKIFIVKASFCGDWYKYNNWFIGSTNCTHSGLHKNYEADVLLRSLESGTSAEDVLDSLLNPNAPLVTKYVVKDSSSKSVKEDEEKKRQRILLYDLSRLNFTGMITKESDNRYATRVKCELLLWKEFKKKYPDTKISIRLFASDMDEWLLNEKDEHCFKSLLCQQLSSFLRVSVCLQEEEKKDFLMQIPVDMPPERHGRIMSEILDSEEKLMRYLLFCLDENISTDDQQIGKGIQSNHIRNSDNGVWGQYALPIYEKLLLASSRNKSALRNIRDNVERLRKAKDKDGNPLLSKEFLKMWDLFAIYAK